MSRIKEAGIRVGDKDCRIFCFYKGITESVCKKDRLDDNLLALRIFILSEQNRNVADEGDEL